MIYSQNFDGVTPPALPSGWDAESGFVTSTAVVKSSPNSLLLPSAGGAKNAVYNTTDGNTGNVSASAWFRINNPGIASQAQLIVRGSTNVAASLTSGNFYSLQVAAGNPLSSGVSLALNRRNAGVNTVLANHSSATNLFTFDVWYKATLHIFTSGATVILIAQVQRDTDGLFMPSTGNTWSSNASTVAISVVDSNASRITGAGYFGFRLFSQTSANVYADDLAIDLLNGAYFPGATSAGTITPTTASIAHTCAVGGTGPYAYQLQQAPDSAGSPGSFSNVGSPQTGVAAGTDPSNFSATGLSASTPYWFRVVVTDNGSVVSTSNPITLTTLSNTLTAGTVSPVAASSTSTTVSATAATGGTGPFSYQFQRAPDVAGSPGTWADVGSPRTGLSDGVPPTDLSDTGLTAGSTYWYRYNVTDSLSATASSDPESVTLTLPALVVGTLSFSTATDTGITLAYTGSSGGVAPYTTALHRSTTADYTPSGATLISSNPTFPYTDSTATAGVTEFYKLVLTDSASQTATSNHTVGNLWLAPIKLGFIGDSITQGNPNGIGTTPSLVGPLLSKTRNQRKVTIYNQGVSGTRTTDWLPASSNLTTAKAAFASAGVTHVHLMLGTNDAILGPNSDGVPATPSQFSTNYHAIVADLVSSGYTVIVAYPPWIKPGSGATHITTEATDTAVLQYEPMIDAEVNGTTILQGDQLGYQIFGENLSLSTDGIHPNSSGQTTLAALWTDGIDRALNPAAEIVVPPDHIVPLGLIETNYWNLDLQAMITDLPATARWDGVEFSCSISQLDQAYALSLVGNFDDVVFEAIIPTVYVASLTLFKPDLRIEIKFPDQTAYTNYQILSVRKSADAVAYTLTLKADHRNA